MKNLSLLLSILFICTHASAFIFGEREAQKEDIRENGLGRSVVGIISSVTEDKGLDGKITRISTCSGTLITREVILTAAHCVTNPGQTIQNTKVFLNKLRLNTSYGVPSRPEAPLPSPLRGGASVQGFVVHPNYLSTNNGKDDIALILLTDAAPSEIHVVPLASTLNLPALPKIVFGYGMLDDEAGAKNSGLGILRWLRIDQIPTIVSSSDGQLYKRDFMGMIRIEAIDKGVCHSDSGGPLFVQDPHSGSLIQVGIAESVIARLDGEELVDFNKMSDDDFKKKHPQAHICRGSQFYVNLADQYHWIQSTLLSLQSLNL